MDGDDPTCTRAAPARLTLSPFARLPDEIIEQILLATDPNGFASLIVLNSNWRAVSQRPHLYLHQLARCPSYASGLTELGPPDHERLPRLRRLFAREVKRGLFDAYLRPNKTTVKVVSNSISSSSCPGGEGMRFSASLNGHHLLAYNSSRIHIIDIRGDDLQVKRQLKILRRPVSACVTDDATLLAVLSTEVQVDLYDMRSSPPKRKRSLILDNCPRTIALSACGSVLAAAYEGGIQVYSLDPGALPTDKRAVKCDAVDGLAFSPDGTQILGTTIDSSSPSTVVLTAPYYDPGSQPADSNLAAMWTASILFPNTSRDCSHAILLPQDGDHGELEWTFTYDRSFETFRAVRLDDLRNGTTYFTGPLPEPHSPSRLLPCTLPALALGGELVAAGFRGNEVWLYGVPGDLEAMAENVASHDISADPSGSGRYGGLNAGLSRHSSSARMQDGERGRVTAWQLICEKQRNNFVAGRKVMEFAGVTNVKWASGLAGSSRERLVVTARGVSGPRLATEDEDMEFVDGGRIALVDFDYRLVDGTETEVALARQITVAQRQRGPNKAMQHATAVENPGSQAPTGSTDDDPLAPRSVGKNPAIRRVPAVSDRSEQTVMDELETLDVPYEHASPRSGTTLRRAATAVDANRRLNPQTADGRPIEYRRADGRAEHPHESDADNWVPPPPPYQKEDPGDLPAFMRGPSVSPPAAPSMPPLPPFSLHDGCLPIPFPPTGPTEADSSRTQRHHSLNRLASVSTFSSGYPNDIVSRPKSSPSVRAAQIDIDDIYDVSPPDSPRLSACVLRGRQPPRSTSFPSEPLASPWADDSLASVRPGPASSRLEVGSTSAQGHVPLASRDINRVSLAHSRPASAMEPSCRRLSNAQTWPLLTTPEAAEGAIPPTETSTPRDAGQPSISPGGAPHANPSADFANGDWTADLPPPPSLEQLASLNRRSSWGSPRRLSGSVRSRWEFSNPGAATTRPEQEAEDRESEGNASSVEAHDFDGPLIISTPTGITGALDPPSQAPWAERDESQILAPIPRRSRQTSLNHCNLVLDDIQGLEPPSRQGTRARRRGSGLPVWLRTSPAASRSPTAPVHVRPSRAERSAAKNMLDARKHGWTGKRGADKKKGGGTHGAAHEASSSAGWTDVSTSSASRDKKCVVM